MWALCIIILTFYKSISHYYVALHDRGASQHARGFPYFVRMRECRLLGQGVLFLEIVHCDINRTGHKTEVEV